jgi:hypothetical protein
MTRASIPHPTQLEVTVMFEPNRMAAALLQSAYLRVAPTLRRSLDRGPVQPALPAQSPEERAEAAERSAQ